MHLPRQESRLAMPPAQRCLAFVELYVSQQIMRKLMRKVRMILSVLPHPTAVRFKFSKDSRRARSVRGKQMGLMKSVKKMVLFIFALRDNYAYDCTCILFWFYCNFTIAISFSRESEYRLYKLCENI